jgi:hypothetical protein
MGGWWKAPRALARMLAEGQLTLNAYALLHFLAESGADREPIAVSNRQLADALDVSPKTIRRALVDLRSKGLIAFDEHERVASFAVRTADTLRTLEGGSVSAPADTLRTTQGGSVSADAVDTPSLAAARELAPEAQSRASRSADSRARAETETGDREVLPSIRTGATSGARVGRADDGLRSRSREEGEA